MRLAVCYRAVRTRGLFLGRRLFDYQRRFGGYVAPAGVGLRAQRWLWQLTDGCWGFILRAQTSRERQRRGQPLKSARWQAAGLILLRQLSPLIDHFWPLAWAVIRYLKTRHHRGWRYRLGLPAHGQRTHSNAATTRRVRGVVATYVRAYYWFRKLWEPRKKPVQRLRAKVRTQSRRAAKAERHRRGVVRTKKTKKSDAWR